MVAAALSTESVQPASPRGAASPVYVNALVLSPVITITPKRPT
ncbi:MAG TPA: hypothetical protein VJ866_07130 [Pyrinomonadaceae bacterium]|nr:hypothetical protein [Pyrinomonadaceae bacterium]